MELPAPQQGIAALVAMSILERDEGLGAFEWGSGQHLHRAVAAMRLAFADALAYNADPDVVPVRALSSSLPVCKPLQDSVLQLETQQLTVVWRQCNSTQCVR